MNESRHYRGGFVWPIILIGAGIVFLLNNLGVVDWNVWATLLRLWPLLLIAIGLDILVGRRFPLGSALLGLVLILVLVLAVQGALPETVTASAVGVDHTETISQDLKGAERASVEIGFGAGNLDVKALAEGSPKLIQGTVDLSRNEQLSQSYSGSSGTVNYILRSRGSWPVGLEVFADSGKSWDLSLTRDVTLDLTIGSGAGRSSIDLTGLDLRSLDLHGGVGQVTVSLPAQGQYTAKIDGGVGQIVIIVPEGLSARVQTNGGLGGITTQGDFSHQDDTYVTGDYNTAENRADIEVQNGVGQVVLKTLSE